MNPQPNIAFPPRSGNDSRDDSQSEVAQQTQSGACSPFQSDDRGPGGNRACLGGRSTSDITYPAATSVKAGPPSPEPSRQTAEQGGPVTGATAPNFPTTPAVVIPEARNCECGCGEQTNGLQVEIAILRAQGLTFKKAEEHLGYGPGSLKAMYRRPPRFKVGHSARVGHKAATYRNCETCGRRFYSFSPDHKWCRADGCQEFHYGMRVAKLTAEWEASQQRQEEQRQVWLELRRKRSKERERTRANRQHTKETVEWLREQVGLGFRRDAPFIDAKLVYLDGLDFRQELKSGDGGWWEDRQNLDPQQLLEQRLQERVAELLVDSDDPLVARAMALPETLTEAERIHLQEVFAYMEQATLTGRFPHAQEIPVNSYSAYGRHLNHGFGSKKTSHQKVRRVQIKKAMGRSNHPSQKPRQKYKVKEIA